MGVRQRKHWARRHRGVPSLGPLAVLCLLLACRPVPSPSPPIPSEPIETPPPAPTTVDPQPTETPVVEVPPKKPQPAPFHTLAQVDENGALEVRVGLATDVERLEIKSTRGLRVRFDGRTENLGAALKITPGDVVVDAVVYRLQVAALKNEEQAQGIAETLRSSTGQPADAVFDAGTDLYRVRVGSFDSREEAEALRQELAQLGIVQGWVASEGGGLENASLSLRIGENTQTVPGRTVEILAPENGGVPYEGVRYRGRLTIHLNGRGRLNVINVLPLEQYLRGVVPKEMGPELYNQLEVLKAQAVAARTYTLRNLGEFDSEGYDICSTPRCQVYGGMAVEHKRSDRAVEETAHQVVLVGGELAETFYSATCGGHTENVAVVFPLKSGEYLRGVPCMEAGAGRLAGGPGANPQTLATALGRRMLPPAKGNPTKVLSARFEHLAFLARLPLPRDHLRDTSRREIVRFVGSAFDLALDPELLVPADRLAAHVATPPASWQPRDERLARSLLTLELTGGDPSSALSNQALEELLFELGLYLGVVRQESARYLSLHERTLKVYRNDQRLDYAVPDGAATFRKRGEHLHAAPLELMAGDRVDLYWRGDEILAAVQPVSARPVDLSRHARRLTWKRYKTRQELTQSVQTRYPGFPFRGFEVLSRGVSGRIGQLKLLGGDGEDLLVEGLAVRWTLDLYDTLFYFKPRGDDPATPGWTFTGRGWGHGVGMCQAGAYGMAARGIDYRAILEHYYSGVELGRLVSTPSRPRLEDLGP